MYLDLVLECSQSLLFQIFSPQPVKKFISVLFKSFLSFFSLTQWHNLWAERQQSNSTRADRMIEVTACLPRGPVFLAGESITCEINFTNISRDNEYVVGSGFTLLGIVGRLCLGGCGTFTYCIQVLLAKDLLHLPRLREHIYLYIMVLLY